jgi:hypothetical protein
MLQLQVVLGLGKCLRNEDNNASAMVAKTPLQCWQQCQHDEGRYISVMRETTPVEHWLRCQQNGSNTGATRATTNSIYFIPLLVPPILLPVVFFQEPKAFDDSPCHNFFVGFPQCYVKE